ncbi:MAG: DUF1840 domain-containing protein [Caldimonas sp.]
MYKFKSKAAGDVLMMESAGDQLLKAIGKEPSDQGIIQAAQMPAAISAIEQAIQADEAARRRAEEAAAAEGRKLPPREGVSLRQRGWPLLEMLKQASRESQDVVWGV